MKTTLTIKQSAELIRRGVSEGIVTTRIPKVNGRGFIVEYSPIFTLTDLLSLLPKVINNGNFYLDFSYGYGDWTASYILWDDCDEGTYIRDTQGEKTAKELVDALYELLLWCLYNNHVKLD